MTATLLTACSSLEEREVASGAFDYVKEQPGQKIKIPDDVDTPKFNDVFKLPDLGENAPMTTVGKNLSVLSPSLVLPVVTGSHIEEGSKSATVWFDQVDDSQPLDTAVWNSLIRFLETEGIGVEMFDKDNQRLITGWVVKDERRNEVDVLNRVVKNYEFETKVASVKRFRQIREGLNMELGFDSDGEPAFVVDGDFDITWPRLLLVLRKLGFDVKDYDKSNGLLFVKYNGAEDGWWSNIWSNDKNELDLEVEEYRIKVSDAGKKTSVTLLDDESNPFPVNKLTDLYPTFSKTMSTDDLDI
jgi:outer membrane protein assembly factor BamC